MNTCAKGDTALLRNGGVLRITAYCLVLLFCNGIPRIATAQGKSDSISNAAPGRQLFDFHISFWSNLHQVLLNEALQNNIANRRSQVAPPLSTKNLAPADRKVWDSAVVYYQIHFASRRELFDDQLININDALATQADVGQSLHPDGLPSDLVAVLKSAAPIYRQYWWADHRRSNEDWLASQNSRLMRLAPPLAAAMTKDLNQAWPTRPIRVDLCFYVGEIGHAYTTIPAHTTFSSSEDSLQSLSGFEVLFHEASHAFSDTMSDALRDQCKLKQKDCGDLWHAVLFYTSGFELKRLLPAGQAADFTPYAEKYGLYDHGRWNAYDRVLRKDWQPYLEGKMNFNDAIKSMAEDLAASPQHQ